MTLDAISRSAALAAFAQLPVAVAVLDRELCFVEVNEAMASLNGVPVEAHIGRYGPDLLPDIDDAAWEVLRRVVATGIAVRGAIVTGTTPATAERARSWQEDFTPWRDEATGAVLGVITVAADITGQLAAEEVAARRRRRLEGIARLSAELVGIERPEDVAEAVARGAARALDGDAAVVAIGTDGDLRALATVGYPVGADAQPASGILTVGTALADTARTGVEHAFTTGSDWDTAFPEGAALHRSVGMAATSTAPLVQERRRVGALGVSFRAARTLDEDDATTLRAIASIGGEAIERARSSQARDETRRLVQAVADNLPAGVLVVDPDLRILYSNLELERILGARVGERLELPQGVFVERGGVRVEASDSSIARVLAGASIVDELERVHALDGRVTDVLLTARPVRDDAGRVQFATMVLADVTERRRSEAFRDAFIDVMAHEVRTPLATISGNVALLARHRDVLPERDAVLVADADAEITRLGALVENLLVLSRVERRDRFVVSEPLLLGHVVAAAVAAEVRRAGAGRIRCTLDADGGRVACGDEGYVTQVVRNLLSNAVKYGAPPVEVVVGPLDEGIAVRVLDRGPGFGIPPADLFEPYVREAAARGRAHGSGIGLFVCRELVTRMGGRIWAANRDGGGAEFGFVLRLWQDEDGSGQA